MPNKKLLIRKCGILAVCLLLTACGVCRVPPASEESGRCTLAAEPWPAADRLFREDPCWLGGDGATSVDLGEGRVLWLFGDSFVCRDRPCSRRDAIIVRNSVAIQSGYDPASATITFYHGSEDDMPASFFPERDDDWFWPGGGVLVEGRLIIFLMEIRGADNELGFDAAGWTAVIVENPRMPPGAWRFTEARVSPNAYGVIIGSATVLREGDYLYSFGVHTKTHDVFLVRWPVSSAVSGDLSQPEWWTGIDGGWMQEKLLRDLPAPLFSGGQIEFTVHREPRCGRYIQIQTKSLTDPSLTVRLAAKITGPWSSADTFYTPIEAGKPGLLVYAGEAQPALSGADMVFTYNVNTIDMERLFDDAGIYYPFFLKGTLHRAEMP
ncbi:MAG: DUF4185 domain-containing protein [Deltaproteobacteria bacterium]|nr:DUF4185 domain-containing protein [Deltaproteobacteria bacterium]